MGLKRLTVTQEIAGSNPVEHTKSCCGAIGERRRLISVRLVVQAHPAGQKFFENETSYIMNIMGYFVVQVRRFGNIIQIGGVAQR